VPEQATDFIFSLIGEELGFLDTTMVVALFVTIILCGARLVWRIADLFGQLLATGITCLIGLQAFINIGVATSSLPNKGLPLPFVSYGGSNLVCLLVCVGILVSIARHAPVRPDALVADAPQTGANPFAVAPAPVVIRGQARSLAAPHEAERPTIGQRLLFWKRKRRHPRFYPPPRHRYQRLPL